MKRNSQSTTFSQHGKSHFNIQKLKRWLNKRACVRGFFEAHYEKKSARGSKPKSQSLCAFRKPKGTHDD